VDYGHPLRFGPFITPVSDSPQAPVESARLSEELGFDLATFQDHPYQPRFLDTWTLISWVAGRTRRIHIAANVLNVPMRPAAVVARASASLDLLSGGRYDPDNVFRQTFPITAEAKDGATARHLAPRSVR
jgi:alkanesulfonate monooxygenase SsuD/methylene tetrahydromethanopterin reductase-like flavin-dependent oxidoreductase (luciferase family)